MAVVNGAGWVLPEPLGRLSGRSAPNLARSRHASVRSLERYAQPGVDAVAQRVAERDPAARRTR